MQCYSICKISLVSHSACLRAARSHCISPSSPVSQKRGDDTCTASWLEAGHASLASAKLLAAAPQRCRCKAGLLAPGRQRGPASGCAGARPGITDSCERTGGLSTASSAPPWSVYQMVKSTGTGFSFPPKLDKLESNELVRGKIKSSALLSKKKNPFADFLSENITNIIRCGT